MTDALCFDLDGTLFDDRQYVRAGLLAAADVVQRETGVDISDELLSAYFRRGIKEGTFDTVLDELGVSTELVGELVTAYHANDAPLVPFPDAEQTLKNLASDYEMAGALYRSCRRRGETVRKLIDCLIGAVAVRHGVVVLHADSDFTTLARHTAVAIHEPPG